MLDAIITKSQILFGLRDTLRAEGFVEVVTPVARRTDLGHGSRAPVDTADGRRYLRTMIGPALRVNLEHHPRVFEIGPCFRPETPDSLHAFEFTMLDLYAAGESFDYLFDLAGRLVAPHIRHTPARLSVADHIHGVFGVDLRHEPVGDLPRRMASHLGLDPATPFKTVLGEFNKREIEPLSAGRALFLTDYPLGGDEPCARRTPGAVALINQFELLVDGIEVVNGYEDEVDGAEFAERAKASGLYDDEQRLARAAIDQGRVPAGSVGLGIGIERLCLVSTGGREIGAFQQSPQF